MKCKCNEQLRILCDKHAKEYMEVPTKLGTRNYIIGDDGDREILCEHGVGHGFNVHTCDFTNHNMRCFLTELSQTELSQTGLSQNETNLHDKKLQFDSKLYDDCGCRVCLEHMEEKIGLGTKEVVKMIAFKKAVNWVSFGLAVLILLNTGFTQSIAFFVAAWLGNETVNNKADYSLGLLLIGIVMTLVNLSINAGVDTFYWLLVIIAYAKWSK